MITEGVLVIVNMLTFYGSYWMTFFPIGNSIWAWCFQYPNLIVIKYPNLVAIKLSTHSHFIFFSFLYFYELT